MSPSRIETIVARRTRSVYVCWVASPDMATDGLSALSRAAGESGIFCDFDGCLAPIVPDPEDARPLDGADAVLERLAARFRIVAIVSGRSVADLAARVAARGVRLVGLHGMEELRDGEVHVGAEAEAARAAIEHVGARLESALRDVPGALLERKGLALAVHFRRAADPGVAEDVAGPLVREAAVAEGLDVVPGRRILEVRPKGGGDKGDAVRRIIEEEKLRGALVGGDDVGDLPAFDAIDGLQIAVRVGVSSPESPEGLSRRADVVVESPEAFVALLDRLASDAASV
jgi:trehalose 6-phosphate phosphatase